MGGDHWVAVVEDEEDAVVLHDPYGYPHARLPIETFLASWKGDAIRFKRSPYTLRSRFRPVALASRAQAIDRTLPHLAETMSANPGGTDRYGGSQALRRLARLLEDGDPEPLRELLIYVSIAVGVRRRIDAARFVEEGGLHRAADLFDSQARLAGGTQLEATQGRWADVAHAVETLADHEEALIREVRPSVGSAKPSDEETTAHRFAASAWITGASSS